jgi:hypothetical protein
MDTDLQQHYALHLGVGSPWEVKAVELGLEEKKVEIELGWQWGAAARCPECGRECSIHDSAPERIWRHLDTLQFTTLIRARTPRADFDAQPIQHPPCGCVRRCRQDHDERGRRGWRGREIQQLTDGLVNRAVGHVGFWLQKRTASCRQDPAR